MAFSSTLILRVINGGSDATTGSGGGFDRGVAGMATDGTTDANTANTASPVFSSASYAFVAGDQGHWLYQKIGTNAITGWFQIASVAGGKATLTASIGSATLDDGGLNIVVGCATVGTPTGITWAIDRSQSSSTYQTYTDLVIDGTTNTDATSSAHPITIADVGNIFSVSSGTGFTVQRVVLSSIPSGVIGRFDKSLGTLGSTGGNAKQGGAFGSPGMAGSIFTAGTWIYVKYNASAYSMTSTTQNVTNGRLNINLGTTLATPTKVLGYDITPGDETANRPSYKLGVNGASNAIITIGATFVAVIENIIIDGNRANFTASRGITSSGAYGFIRRVKVMGCSAIGINSSASQLTSMTDVEVTDTAGTSGITGAAIVKTGTGRISIYGCNIHDNTNDGFNCSGTTEVTIVRSIFSTNKNGSANSAIVTSGVIELTLINNVIYNSGTHGVDLQVACWAYVINNAFESNGGYGLNTIASQVLWTAGNAYYNNTSGKYPSGVIPSRNIIGEVIPTGTVFTAAGSNDFTLNNTASQGALLRAVGYIASLQGFSKTGYLDIGAIQHQDAGGGSFAFTFAG